MKIGKFDGQIDVNIGTKYEQGQIFYMAKIRTQRQIDILHGKNQNPEIDRYSTWQKSEPGDRQIFYMAKILLEPEDRYILYKI